MPPKSSPALASVTPMAMRQFLKQSGETPDWTEDRLRKALSLDAKEASTVLAAMQMSGYIEPVPRRKGTWRNTPEGNAVAGITAARPIARKTADKKLEEFRERMREVNANAKYLFRVDEAVLFGSYLREGETVKDLDLAVRLGPKEPNQAKHERLMKQRGEAAESAGKRFPSYKAKLDWGRKEVLDYLKSRSRAISLYELADWVFDQPHREVEPAKDPGPPRAKHRART